MILNLFKKFKLIKLRQKHLTQTNVSGCNFYYRKHKLYEIKRVRKIRDEIMKCDNAGRGVNLLFKMPEVTYVEHDVYDYYYGSGRRININLKGGYEFSFAGYESYVYYIKNAAEFVYMRWLKNYSH